MTTAQMHKLGYVNTHGNVWERRAVAPLTIAEPLKRKTIRQFIVAPVVSEANQGGKLRAKLSRKKAQKMAVVDAFKFDIGGQGKPKRVTFVLLTNQLQDDDNLSRTFKVHRDMIAMLCGFDDKERVWKYRQEKRRRWEPRGCWIMVEF